jgi:hypothetical protein
MSGFSCVKVCFVFGCGGGEKTDKANGISFSVGSCTVIEPGDTRVRIFRHGGLQS